MTPRPLEDDAWRTGDTAPGVAHFYGWEQDHDGHSKCWASTPLDGTRQASEDDVLCPDCEAWYWERIEAVPTMTDRAAAAVAWTRPIGARHRWDGSFRRVGGALGRANGPRAV